MDKTNFVIHNNGKFGTLNHFLYVGARTVLLPWKKNTMSLVIPVGNVLHFKTHLPKGCVNAFVLELLLLDLFFKQYFYYFRNKSSVVTFYNLGHLSPFNLYG